MDWNLFDPIRGARKAVAHLPRRRRPRPAGHRRHGPGRRSSTCRFPAPAAARRPSRASSPGSPTSSTPPATEIGVLRRFDTSIPVKQKDIPEILKQAVVAAEDKRFYSHGGIDLMGALRALWADFRGREVVQGGSTITQQYVKNVYTRRRAHPGPQDPGGGARQPARPQGHQGRDPLPLPVTPSTSAAAPTASARRPSRTSRSR